jgi:hypothetical protein
MKVQDTLLAVLSDLHTGSSTALFPREGYTNSEGNHVLPNDKQKEIYPVFIRYAGEVAKARKGKRLIVVNLGDAIDGFHHGSMQESLFMEKDQCGAHVSLMQEFMQRVGFQKGDELHYVRGTEVHVKEAEHDIAKELGVAPIGKKMYVNEVLSLNINSAENVFVHHGKQRGAGQNEGNALRNFLRDIRSDREKDGLSRIDVLWSAHTHGHTYSTHIARERDGQFHTMHGIILPSWQAKTRFAYAKVPMVVNSVGGVYVNIGVDGAIGCPHFVVQNTKDR